MWIEFHYYDQFIKERKHYYVNHRRRYLQRKTTSDTFCLPGKKKETPARSSKMGALDRKTK